MSSSTFFLPRITWYCGRKSCSTSTPNLLFGRSLTWPIDAMTVYFLPKYLFSVLAFDGDSTMTSDFFMPVRAPGPSWGVDYPRFFGRVPPPRRGGRTGGRPDAAPRL